MGWATQSGWCNTDNTVKAIKSNGFSDKLPNRTEWVHMAIIAAAEKEGLC
jgi:hypothetical protein